MAVCSVSFYDMIDYIPCLNGKNHFELLDRDVLCNPEVKEALYNIGFETKIWYDSDLDRRGGNLSIHETPSIVACLHRRAGQTTPVKGYLLVGKCRKDSDFMNSRLADLGVFIAAQKADHQGDLIRLSGISFGGRGASREDEASDMVYDVAGPSGKKGVVLDTYFEDNEDLQVLRQIAWEKCPFADVYYSYKY